MPYLSLAQRQCAEWCTIREVIAHLRTSDHCGRASARRQLRKALTDGVLAPLRWKNEAPPITWPPEARLRGGELTTPNDGPPSPDLNWGHVGIDWRTGRALDIWDDDSWDDGPRRRVLLIRRDKLSRVWPEPTQPLRTPARAGPEAASVAAETKATEHLTGLMKAGNPKQSKAAYREHLLPKFRTGKRAFDRAWANAIKASGNTEWSRPGRKSTR
jgi:hypothetical protein